MQESPGRVRKRFGQHFLGDRGAVRRIVETLGPAAGDAVLEIGPGRGALTVALLDAGARVAAVELDRDLAAYLRERFAGRPLRVVQANVLEVSFDDVARELGVPSGERLLVAGNLPYNISKPVATEMVAQRRSVRSGVLMFQREVAERIVAAPGSKDYGPLSVLVSRAYRVRRCFDLRPGAFHPPPSVVSSVTAWQPVEPAPGDEGLDRLRSCLSIAFASRRKTLRNNLRAVLPAGDADALLADTGIDASVRPEQVSPEAYVRLARSLPLV